MRYRLNSASMWSESGMGLVEVLVGLAILTLISGTIGASLFQAIQTQQSVGQSGQATLSIVAPSVISLLTSRALRSSAWRTAPSR